MGNLLANQWIAGLVGPIRSQNRLAAEGEELSLDQVANTPAVALYLSSAVQLGLLKLRDDAIPQLTRERGALLAIALQEQVSDLAFAQIITSADPPSHVSREELTALGKAIPMNKLSEKELDVLGNALLPETPYPHEKPRIATYAGLFVLAKSLQQLPQSHQYLAAACQYERFGDVRLNDWADAWLAYGIRDMLAVAQEFLCAEIIDELMLQGGERNLPVASKTVIRNMLTREGDLLRPLVDLGLASPDESIGKLSIATLIARVTGDPEGQTLI